jgi:hypothetical protein
MSEKLTEYEFIVRAIKKLRKPPYKGIHTVYSGFNQAFREYFGTNPVEVTQRLAAEGRIVTRPVKGGVTIYLPEDAPAMRGAGNVLERILAEEKPAEGLEVLGPADDEDPR